MTVRTIVHQSECLNMTINKITECPICKHSIHIGLHLCYNETVGIECPTCNSVLAHTGKTVVAKFALLAIFIVFVAFGIQAFGADRNIFCIFWIFAASVSLVLLTWLQLTADFKIKYENKRYKRAQKK